MAAKQENKNILGKSEVPELTSEKIMSLYMNHVLENGERPRSIYKFAHDHGMEERDFYRFFGSFEGLKQQIWITFYDHTILVLDKDEEYANYPNREKILSFFFTFFELLTVNRSYVLFTLGEHKERMKNLQQLKMLRSKVKDFCCSAHRAGK